MKYIIAFPDNAYFRWQVLVQINNLKKFGLEKDLIYVAGINNRRSKKLNLIEKETGIKIYSYKDERYDKNYASSLRPHILKKFFKEYPEMGKCFFYTDPDVIFSQKPSYETLIKGNTWFLSDTRSYINSHYIKRKGKKLFEEMCNIVGINENVVTNNDRYAGGAQYIMKNVNERFWEKVEIDCENLYLHMIMTKGIYTPEHPIQAWTADMWAVLWNAWNFGYQTKILKRMNFSWATDKIEKWDEKTIHHNAGVAQQKHLFKKGLYSNSTPFNKDLSYVDENYCSFKYVEEIKDTEKNYKNLIKGL